MAGRRLPAASAVDRCRRSSASIASPCAQQRPANITAWRSRAAEVIGRGLHYEVAVARIARRMVYRKTDGILTRGERAFWLPLRQAVGERYLILCKVRLADLTAAPDHRADSYRRFRDIGMFHVDFVLCDPRTTAPLLVIELDDRSHGILSVLKRDRFKDAVLSAARLPIYRVPCQDAYAPIEIAEEVRRRLGTRRD